MLALALATSSLHPWTLTNFKSTAGLGFLPFSWAGGGTPTKMNPRPNQPATIEKRVLFRVKAGRILLFPNVPSENNQHLWAKWGEVVDATHPVLRAIVALTGHNVTLISEADLKPGEQPVSRMHSSVKAKMKEWDEREATRVVRATTAAASKAKTMGVDPNSLPKLGRDIHVGT